MSPGFKTSLAALAVAGLMFAPIVGTGIAYADDTSTEEATSQVATSSSDDQAKADEAAKKAADEKKAQEEADAKKAADEATEKAEPTPTPELEVSPTTDPTQSSTPEVVAKAKVASVNTYKPVSEYFDPASECEAAGIDVKADAPDLLVEWNGGSQTVHAGDNFRVDTTASAIDFTVSIKSDSSNKVSVSIKVLQGNECPAADPDTDGDGYTDSAEKAAGSDPNDPKSTPVDLDGDGVLNESDKCPGTASGAKVDKDGCSADQLDNTDLKKVELCHATGSDSNPYTDITVSVAAFYNAGHVDHSGDIWAAFSYTKKGVVYNVAAQGDQSILANGCVKPKPKKQYALVLWKVDESRAPYTSGMPLWPQDYTKSVIPVDTKPTEATIKAAFPAELKGTQKCVAYQGDGYEYTTKSDRATVDGLIAGGVLTDYADSSVYIAHAYYVNSDCTTYYDAPTIQVWDQKCVVGDQGVGQYTDGGFVVTASDKVPVVVKDGDDKVVTDTSSVKPGVYTVFATAPKGGAWNKLPDGWSYVDESKTVIKTVVTVKAAKDCSVQKPPPITVPKSDSKSDCYGFYTRSWNEVKYPVWKDEAWTFDGVEPVIENDTGFVFDRALTNDEWWKLGCYPEQPPNLVVPMQDTKSDCYAHYLRTWDLVTTYTWVWAEGTENGRGSWVAQEPVVQNDTGWVLQSVLTNDEWWAMGCNPEQPPVLVDHQFDTKATCDGHYKSTWDLVSTPVWTWFEGEEWSPENRGEWVFQQPVVENFKDWFWTGKLSSAEKKELSCTSGPLNGNSPDVPWGPIGVLAGLAVLAARGAWFTSRRRYNGTQG